jgi:RsiW-degrading membrane proteinase PrsW (M82 family)
MIPYGALRALIVAVALAFPLIFVVRSNKKLTWTTAILLGSWLVAITVVLLGDVPSRILYWFDAQHAPLAERFTFLQFWESDIGGNPGYQLVADIVANTVQGIFFVIIAAAAYFWGEKHRKEGKFKS